jgi:hypothetical protein
MKHRPAPAMERHGSVPSCRAGYGRALRQRSARPPDRPRQIPKAAGRNDGSAQWNIVLDGATMAPLTGTVRGLPEPRRWRPAPDLAAEIHDELGALAAAGMPYPLVRGTS